MSQTNTDAAKTVLDLARVRNESFIDTLKAQRGSAQDNAAALAAEVAVLRNMLETSRERERVLSADVEQLTRMIAQLKNELDAARVSAPPKTARKSRAQQQSQ